MGIDLKVTVIIIQIDVVRIVCLNVLCRKGTPIRRLTGTCGIHHSDITVHRTVFFRSASGHFAGRPPRGDRRYPSHSPSGGSWSLSGDRYLSSRESSCGRYPSPRRFSHTSERYREGHRPPGHGRYGEDHRHYNRGDRSSTYRHGSGHKPQRFEERAGGSSQERKVPKNLNSKGLGVPATNS